MKAKSNDNWAEAQRLCGLTTDEVRMARELGIGPRVLTSNIPNAEQRWKAPVGVWIRNLYAKRMTKAVLPDFDMPHLAIRPGGRLREADFDPPPAESHPPTRHEIADENTLMQRRQREFRIAAEYVAAAFAQLEPVKKVVLFGSVASALGKEIPRFREFRRARVSIFHECSDADLAVWLTDLSILKSLQRARSRALNQLLADREIGVAHHQVEVFLMSPGDGAYLGRLCNFGECPKGRAECLVKDCGASKFLRQIEGFAFHSEALSGERAITLFERK
ncbi:MAG: hypothetical protein ACRD3D_17545 [Terriglobia bacterium]